MKSAIEAAGSSHPAPKAWCRVLIRTLGLRRKDQKISLTRLAEMLSRDVAVVRDWEMSRRYPPLPDFIEWSNRLGLRLRVSDEGDWLPWDVYAMVIPRHRSGAAAYELHRYATVFKMRRDEFAMTIERLAELVGVTPATIERWESGAATPALVRMIAHAQALDLVVELVEKSDALP